MKNLFLLAVAGLLFWGPSSAQKYYTKTGRINFDATSATSPERIEAINRTATCVIDIQTGNMQFAVLMKGFEFERALMQEHFNENYMESHKFPKAEFKGDIKKNDAVNYSKDGTYPVKVKGKLTLHGKSNDVEADARIIIEKGKISAMADFSVKLEDFNVSIPGLVADKISKDARIKVSCSLEPLKN